MSFIAKLAAIVISFSLCAAGLLFVPRKSATKTETANTNANAGLAA